LVLASNLSAAVPMVLWPDRYTGGFEVAGTPGLVLVRSIGLLFLMWVVPYVPAILHPQRYRICLMVILAQQCIGLLGESLMAVVLPAGHPALWATGTRYIIFDTAGLFLLGAAWYLSRPSSGATHF
jgi:hypothetical protein